MIMMLQIFTFFGLLQLYVQTKDNGIGIIAQPVKLPTKFTV